MKNELRERVVLRVDGGMRSGRDVLVAAALGGDEYGFGTVAMIATGCVLDPNLSLTPAQAPQSGPDLSIYHISSSLCSEALGPSM